MVVTAGIVAGAANAHTGRVGGASDLVADLAGGGPIERDRSRTPRTQTNKPWIPLPADASSLPSVEEFCQQNGLDDKCMWTLKGQPLEVQLHVMAQGPVEGGKNPSAMMTSRIQKCLNEYTVPIAAYLQEKVEDFIGTNGLDESVGQSLRDQSDECKSAVLSLGPVD